MLNKKFGIRVLILLGIILAALASRAPITAVSPLAKDIEESLGINDSAYGLLTSVSLICFSIFSIVGNKILNKFSAEKVIVFALIISITAQISRSFGDYQIILISTIAIGAMVAISNVVIPTLIKRDFAKHSALLFGLNAAMMNLGITIAERFTVPVTDGIGGGNWRFGLGFWLIFAVVALIVWIITNIVGKIKKRNNDPIVIHDEEIEHAKTELSSVYKRPITWLLGFQFMCHCFVLYGVFTWVPTLLRTELGYSREDAGSTASLFQLFGIAGGLLIPIAIKKFNWSGAFCITAILWAILPIGMLVDPKDCAIWLILSGLAQGANINIMMSRAVSVSRSVPEARKMSATNQTMAYLGASISPTLFGFIHTTTNSFQLTIIMALVVIVVMSGLGFYTMQKKHTVAIND